MTIRLFTGDSSSEKQPSQEQTTDVTGFEKRPSRNGVRNMEWKGWNEWLYCVRFEQTSPADASNTLIQISKNTSTIAYPQFRSKNEETKFDLEQFFVHPCSAGTSSGKAKQPDTHKTSGETTSSPVQTANSICTPSFRTRTFGTCATARQKTQITNFFKNRTYYHKENTPNIQRSIGYTTYSF